jgi:hypothetical protein
MLVSPFLCDDLGERRERRERRERLPRNVRDTSPSATNSASVSLRAVAGKVTHASGITRALIVRNVSASEAWAWVAWAEIVNRQTAQRFVRHEASASRVLM